MGGVFGWEVWWLLDSCYIFFVHVLFFYSFFVCSTACRNPDASTGCGCCVEGLMVGQSREGVRGDGGRVWKGRGWVGVGEKMEDNVLARGVRPEGPVRWYFVLGGEGVDDLRWWDLDVWVGDWVGEIVSEVFGYFTKEKSYVAVIESM